MDDEVDQALRLADAGDFEDGQWIVDALAAEVRRLRAELANSHELADAIHRNLNAAGAEIERLRDTSPYVPCRCGRTIHLPTLAALVAKVEAGAAVVGAWNAPDFDEDELKHVLDELVRVYGDGERDE
jgi:hypothetical protein